MCKFSPAYYVSENRCKDTININKLYVLENFSRVKKCQSADYQILDFLFWKTLFRMSFLKLFRFVTLPS